MLSDYRQGHIKVENSGNLGPRDLLYQFPDRLEKVGIVMIFVNSIVIPTKPGSQSLPLSHNALSPRSPGSYQILCPQL